MNAYGAYSVVAGVCSLASLLIAFGTIKTLSQITDSGMWAIAAMTLMPAAMGLGIAAFINQSHVRTPARDVERPQPIADPDEGAFTPPRRPY